MRFGDGNVKLRRLFAGICGRVFDDETLGGSCGLRVAGCGLTATANRHGLQTEITPDAVLQMHDEIAVIQVGKINVECRAGGQRVRRFLAARPLDFVASEDLRIGVDNQFRLVADKSASEL